MIRTKLKNLERTKLEVLDRLDNIHDADADPNVKAIYQSDLQYDLACIEEKIEFEKTMFPFSYMLVGLIVAAICIIIYFII